MNYYIVFEIVYSRHYDVSPLINIFSAFIKCIQKFQIMLVHLNTKDWKKMSTSFTITSLHFCNDNLCNLFFNKSYKNILHVDATLPRVLSILLFCWFTCKKCTLFHDDYHWADNYVDIISTIIFIYSKVFMSFVRKST